MVATEPIHPAVTGRRSQARSSGPGAFEQVGYEVLEGFLDASSIAALRPEINTVLQAPPMPGCERPHNRLAPLRWSDPIVRQLIGDAEGCRDLARRIGADDLRWISGYVSVKEANTAPLWWHQDWWCWDHEVSLRPAAAQVALLCYLTDTTRSTGALRVLPGSHHRSTALHAQLPAAHEQGDALPSDDPAMSDQPGQATLELRAGDAVVLDYRLLHGTHPNNSAARRDCVLLSFTPSWRGLPADVRGHLTQHLALPSPEERATNQSAIDSLPLPSFDGVPADLRVNVCAPARFAVRQLI